jgi:hypothetical protein
MNLKPLNGILLFMSLLAVMASCNKTEDVPEQYLRAGNGIAIAADGNLIIAGYNTSTSRGYEATLIKANAVSGDTAWSRKFGNSYSDAFYTVKNSNEGGFIAAGFSNRSSTGSPTMFVVITDALGTSIKTATYGGTAYSQAFSVLPNADSGYLVAGYQQKTSTSDRDIYLVRINNAGAIIWEKTIGAKGVDTYDTVNDAAYSVIAAPDGGYFLTGSLKGYSSYGGQIFLMKVSSSGDSLWTKTFGDGIGYSVTLTADNKVAISGTFMSGTSQDVFLLKTDTAGNKLWDKGKIFGGTGYEYGATMISTSDGGFALTGITDRKGTQDAYLILTDANGESSGKEYTYGGNDVEQGYGLVQMSDGGFCLTGLSNTGGSFIFLNRTDSQGATWSGWPRYIH